MSILIFAVILVIIGSAFSSSTEAAIFSVSKIKLKTLIDKGDTRAKVLLFVKNNIARHIAGLVIMNNLFNIAGSIYLGVLAHDVLVEDWKIGIFSTVLTLLVILFGEITPKNLGERFALQYGLFSAPAIVFFSTIFLPITWTMEKTINFFFGHNQATSISEEEIKVMVEQGKQDKSIELDEHNLIQNVFNMNDKTAQNIMTPRVNIEALEIHKNLKELQKEIYDTSHSRLMVFGEDYDDIKGFVLIRDVLEAMSNGEWDKTPADFLNQIIRIKESTRVDSLLIMFQKRKTHIALVVDEFGGTSGLVTLEDVLEELVGEIVDETDEVVDMRMINEETEKTTLTQPV